MIEAGIEFAAIMLGGLVIAVTCGAVGVAAGELKDAALRALHRR